VKVALIDTGPMVALFDASDVAHHHYTSLLADNLASLLGQALVGL
jgi:predicted nucleic acid-binding protein